MPDAKILGFPLKGNAQPVTIHEEEPGYIGPEPSPGCIEEIEAMERQNRRNAAALLQRNFILD